MILAHAEAARNINSAVADRKAATAAEAAKSTSSAVADSRRKEG